MSGFRSQLFYALTDYPWPPGKRLRPIVFWLCNLAARSGAAGRGGLGRRTLTIRSDASG